MKTPLDAPDSNLMGVSSEKDKLFWSRMEQLEEHYPHSLKHVLTHWPVYVKRVNVMRFLAHYELFKMTTDLPGSIVELGVSRGVSLFSWHKFLEILCPTDTSKRIFGFDSFEGLQDFTASDGSRSMTDQANDKTVGGWSADQYEVHSFCELHNRDGILASRRITIMDGRVQETIPEFLREFPGVRISLLHFDLDLYEPTKFCLEQLWDLVVPGGVVVFDEYGIAPWAGEGNAFDEFCKERSIVPVMKKIPWTLTPTAYVVKGTTL